MMKFRTRRSSLLTLLLFVTVYWFWSNLRIRYRKAIGTLPENLIIFGDESASTRTFPNLSRRDLADLPNLQTWPTHLCTTLRTTCHSFAPSSTSANTSVVLDNVVFHGDAPDLRQQVGSWIAAETKRRKDGIEADLSSLFAVSFGMNEMWAITGLEEQMAKAALEASLDSLFEQLTRIAGAWPVEVQVMVPTAVDVTVLPVWRKERVHEDQTGGQLRRAVGLRKRWNEGLEFRAKKWRHGRVLFWDANRWLLDMVRNREGKLKDVEGACVQEGKDGVCERPEEFLMWDDFHLGPRTQSFMAQDIVNYLLQP